MKEEESTSSVHHKLRLILTVIFVLMVTLSPIVVMQANPVFARTTLPTISTIPSAPSTIGQDGRDGDFTTQAALAPPASFLSNDLVGSKAIYEIIFVTTTTGIIKKIEMTFPAGTDISGAGIIERLGIGHGTLTKAGTTVTLNVQNAVSVPAGTYIRLEMVNIKNPSTPSSNYQVTVTTRNPANGLLDGPTRSTAYNIKQISTNDIGVGAITTNKINDNLAYQRELTDGENRWNPDGSTTSFVIWDWLTTGNEVITVALQNRFSPGPVCGVTGIERHLGEPIPSDIFIQCTGPPQDGTTLRYAAFNLPVR